MGEVSEAKSDRMLVIYSRLQAGQVLKKSLLAQEFGVTERSIQRDLESLRCFLTEQMLTDREILYDRAAGGYRMERSQTNGLSNGEILSVCKILLESRSLRQDEMMPILARLIDCCVPESNRKAVRQLVANEQLHYIEPRHGKPLVDRIWSLGQAIQGHKVLEMAYRKPADSEPTVRLLEPVGLMCSEYYFYLVGFIRQIDKKEHFDNPDDLFPTIYRVDRIETFRETGERFTVPYANRFQEGEFRKRVQFMFGGRLQTVEFTYSGPSIEAVLDRLPTAEVLKEENGVYTVRAEVFGKGIEMWMRSQGEYITRIGGSLCSTIH